MPVNTVPPSRPRSSSLFSLVALQTSNLTLLSAPYNPPPIPSLYRHLKQHSNKSDREENVNPNIATSHPNIQTYKQTLLPPSSDSEDDSTAFQSTLDTIASYRLIQHSRRRHHPPPSPEKYPPPRIVPNIPRPADLPHGEIHYGYHDHIAASSRLYRDYSAVLNVYSIGGITALEYITVMKAFRGWKRVAWWRVVRVREGVRGVKRWQRVTREKVCARRAGEKGER